jgi:hypothetical protein
MAKETIRVRCPCCQQMTDLERMADVKDKPAVVQVFIMSVLGKAPSVPKAEGEPWKKVGRGKAPGLITYTDITDNMSASQVKPIVDWFNKRAKMFFTGK